MIFGNLFDANEYTIQSRLYVFSGGCWQMDEAKNEIENFTFTSEREYFEVAKKRGIEKAAES